MSLFGVTHRINITPSSGWTLDLASSIPYPGDPPGYLTSGIYYNVTYSLLLKDPTEDPALTKPFMQAGIPARIYLLNPTWDGAVGELLTSNGPFFTGDDGRVTFNFTVTEPCDTNIAMEFLIQRDAQPVLGSTTLVRVDPPN